MVDELLKLVELTRNGGILIILIAIGYGGYRRWWYWGYVVDDLKAQLTAEEKAGCEWKTLYLGLVGRQTQLVEALEVVIRQEK